MNKPELKGEVWVIDDEELLVEMTASMLRNRWPGLKLRCFTDSRKAWAALQRRQPDLVITGSQMPAASGEEIVTGLRKMEARCEILVVSGYAPARVWVRRHRGVKFLAKPFTERQLARAAGALLRRGRR